MSRKRLSWSEKDLLPVERARQAAAQPPATPNEGTSHPAHTPEPGHSDHETGTTSTWAEDPVEGPYPESAHPATPDEGPSHPAHSEGVELPPSKDRGQVTNEDLGVSKAAARQALIAAEQKAFKCLRVAEQLLGPKASQDRLQEQALAYMDMDDAILDATLDHLAEDFDEIEDFEDYDDYEVEEDEVELAFGKESSEDLLRRLLAEEGMLTDEDHEDDSEDEGHDKESSEDLLRRLLAEEGMLTAEEHEDDADEDDADEDDSDEDDADDDDADDDDADDDDDKGSDKEASLDVIAELRAEVAALREELASSKSAAPHMEMDIDLSPVEDPMSDPELDEDDALLAEIMEDQAPKYAADESDESEESEESEDKKEASLRPRPRKASTGVTRLRSVQASAADTNEVSELEKLWQTAPDVSDVFGS